MEKSNFLYIEDVSAAELKSAIFTNEDLYFKHKDCSLVFSSDHYHLYATDIDDLEFDPFCQGNFSEVIKSYCGDTKPVIELLKSLANEDLLLELSDHFNNHNLSFSEL